MKDWERWKKFADKYLYGILTVLLFLLFLVTRLWRVTTIPSGLHVDEAGMAYDAWCLANYGVDRYLKSWPVYLINFGGGQSAMYCYLCAGLFKLFGYHVLLIRLPGIFFSFLTFLFGMLLVRKLYPQNKYLSLIAGGLITICPYFIMAGRIGLDCNLMLGMSTVFLYCFICAVENGKYHWYAIAGLTGGLVLYTYAISYLALPLFLLLNLGYLLWVKRFSFTRWLVMAVPMGGLAFPLLLEQYINAFDLEEIRLGIFTVTKMATYRASEIEGFHRAYFKQALYSIFSSDPLRYNSIPNFRVLYYLTPSMVILGLVYLLMFFWKTIKKREYSPLIYPFFWFVVLLAIESCLISNCNKINGIFFSVIFLAVSGVQFILRWGKRYAKVILLCCFILYGIEFARFGTYYYLGSYTADNYPLNYFDIIVPEAVEFLEENPQYQNKGTYLAESPVYLALSLRESPYDMRLDEGGDVFFAYYHCNTSFVAIDQDYNYIVRDIYVDYATQLRIMGYTEIPYAGYSLFYQEK